MKKNKSLIAFIFIYLTTFLCMIQVVAGDGCFWSSGWFINVANEIKDEPNKILVECKSKDNDMGSRTLGYNESYHWQFCEDIVSPSTLYFCHFYYGFFEQVFDVFNGNMKHNCIEPEKKEYWRCTWLIKMDGFYFVDRTSGERKDVKMYDWKLMPNKQIDS